jgi:superfamily II DNA or RNA helicase
MGSVLKVSIYTGSGKSNMAASIWRLLNRKSLYLSSLMK